MEPLKTALTTNMMNRAEKFLEPYAIFFRSAVILKKLPLAALYLSFIHTPLHLDAHYIVIELPYIALFSPPFSNVTCD